MENMDTEKGFELELDVIELEQEDGSTIECVIQDEFEIDDKAYMVLSPIDDNDYVQDEIVYYYRVEYEDEDMIMETIDDEEELKVVMAAYDAFISPDFDEEGE